MKQYRVEYEKWLAAESLCPEMKAELLAIAGDEKEIEDRFYMPLSFGTAGLRGVMGAGINRMNTLVVAQATQALAEVILAEGGDAAKRGVAVGYDCRHNSESFARTAASVLAANGISVYIFDAMRPTPEVSFAILRYGCIAGVNITASHNPKEYNGYKAYWEEGAQIGPEQADAVEARIRNIDIFTGAKTCDFEAAVAEGKIRVLGRETDEEFLERVLSLSVYPAEVKKAADDLKIVYTPFHGTGYKLVPEILSRLGFKHIICEPRQMVPDGDFPTVVSPNPENKEGFTDAIALAAKENVDLIIGTDPDADRVGIVIRDASGNYVTLTGNQVGVLLLDYIIAAHKDLGTLPEKAAVVKSIVTTDMTRAVAEYNGVRCAECFTGFKFIAGRIADLAAEGYEYLLGFEESYGYLCGHHARDKDAVCASMLIAEMAAYWSNRGKTLYDAMQAAYAKYGYFAEKTVNIRMAGIDGFEKMQRIMKDLHAQPPKTLGDFDVLACEDYLSGKVTASDGNVIGETEVVGSDVLIFRLSDGVRLAVRPSGTEPKMKVYALVQGPDAETVNRRCEAAASAAETLTR